jgi:hypothetical protein
MKLEETYKEKISSEIEGLSEAEIEKIIKMIHLLKTEFLGKNKKASMASFRKARGAWKDVDIDSIYKKLTESWGKWKPTESV